MMNRQALLDYAINIFGNVAVIGIGLGIYDGRPWCVIVAMAAMVCGGLLAWMKH